MWERGKERAKRVRRHSAKVTFCILDEHAMAGVSVEPAPRRYSTCERDVQGLSVGWADEYGANLWDQWIDLGHEPLGDGRYLLRSVADPRNLLGEGGRQQNSERNNKGIACFAVEGGALRLTRC